MANNTVHIIDASTLIAVRNIASAANDPRFFNALLPPGKMVIIPTDIMIDRCVPNRAIRWM
jgi:hypothetical protein